MNSCTDCKVKCGDGICSPTEYAWTCPSDCPAKCGDYYCDRARLETALTCPADCPRVCGDKVCDPRGETYANCKTDCPTVGQVGGRKLLAQEHQSQCGDGMCTGEETAANCVADCPPVCGDGHCDFKRGENMLTCPADCKRLTCGDGVCEGGLSCLSHLH